MITFNDIEEGARLYERNKIASKGLASLKKLGIVNSAVEALLTEENFNYVNFKREVVEYVSTKLPLSIQANFPRDHERALIGYYFPGAPYEGSKILVRFGCGEVTLSLVFDFVKDKFTSVTKLFNIADESELKPFEEEMVKSLKKLTK